MQFTSVLFIYRFMTKIENFMYIYRNEIELQAVRPQCVVREPGQRRSITKIRQRVSRRGDGGQSASQFREKNSSEVVSLSHITGFYHGSHV